MNFTIPQIQFIGRVIVSLILRRHGHIVSEAPGQICVHVRRFADLLSGEFHSLHRENILLLDNADKRPGVMQVVGPLCLLSVVAAGNSLCMPVEPPGGNMQDPHSLVDPGKYRDRHRCS